jgi:hypothetical protein
MQTNPRSQSAFFIPRIITAFVLCAAAVWMAMLSFASSPSSGTLSDVTPILNYDAGPLTINQTPLSGVVIGIDDGPRCDQAFQCDSYALTITLPVGYVAANPGATARVSLYWTNTDPTNNAASDYDLYVYRGVVGDLDGSRAADWYSAGDSSSNPEVANVTPLSDGTNQYTIKIVGFQPAGETVHVRIELVSGSTGGFPGFGQADPTTPGVPRYQIFNNTTADAGQNNGQGEFNIGYNNTTKRIMAYNGLQADIYRVTPAEVATLGKPECCAETWTQKAPGLGGGFAVGLDPILFTDNWTDATPLPNQPTSGARTFVANSTAGTNEAYAVTDNDGDSYLPTDASPPNASSDHETIGAGPYPAALSALGTPVNHGHAVYYCAQTYPVGAAACQRSDTYGDSYGPSFLPYNGNVDSICGGIHGHVKVGPDGTVYLPVRSCDGNAGLAVSMDAGTTWTQYSVPNSPVQTHGSDPSIAVGSDNTVYIFYIASNPDRTEGHVHVQVSTDHGATWSKDTDLGIAHGVINSAFPEAVAGDGDRAACGFLGTDHAGFYEGLSFAGYWYLFIATTYDRGDSWHVVNATPNDPVQGKGGIWQGGGSGIQNRNLLDFNEVTMDEKGRVLFGYSDGCTGTCVGNPDNNTFRAAMRVARQIGGKPLFSAFDPNPAEPAVPKAPCPSGTRNGSGVHLTWRAPDNGGANIVSYAIYRGTSAGTETFLIATGNTKLTFDDITADPTQPVYYKVRAINSVDALGGTLSNEVNFPATPGIQLLSITSQKTHGTAGTFGIDVPLNGSAIECRTAGALPAGATGDYQLVFDFANNVTSVGNVTVTGAGNPTASGSAQGGNYVVNLSGITNAQKIVVTLTNVTDSAGNNLASLNVVMGVLIGDVNASKRTDAGDVTQVRNRTVSIPDATTFRFDVNNSGRIDAGDVTTTRNATVTVLP